MFTTIKKIYKDSIKWYNNIVKSVKIYQIMSKYLDKIIKIKTKESLMNRLKSLKIKNYKHIGDSYIGFDKLENLNILVGQNNIGKSTLLQSIEMLISENVTNLELSTDTMLEFGFCPTEKEIEDSFAMNQFGFDVNYYMLEYGKKYTDKYMTFEFQPIETNIRLSLIHISEPTRH